MMEIGDYLYCYNGMDLCIGKIHEEINDFTKADLYSTTYSIDKSFGARIYEFTVLLKEIDNSVIVKFTADIKFIMICDEMIVSDGLFHSDSEPACKSFSTGKPLYGFFLFGIEYDFDEWCIRTFKSAEEIDYLRLKYNIS